MIKTRTKEILINLSVFLLSCGLFLFGVLYSILKFNSNIWKVIGFSVLGLVANYVIALFLHELGHLIVAKIKGMKINYVNFGLFSVDFSNNDVSVRLFTFFGKNAGESVFLPVKTPTQKDFSLLAFGGLFNSFLYLAIIVAIGLIWNSSLGYTLFIAGSAGAFYLFAVNILPFDKTSDGAIFFGCKYIKGIALGYELLKEINENKIPKKPEIIEQSDLPLMRYFNYIFLARSGDKNRCCEIIDGFSKELEKLSEDEYEFIFPEVVFFSCTEGIIPENIKSMADNYFCGCNNTISIMRAHYAYRMFQGEETWAETIKNSYLKKLEESPLFVKEAEKNLGSWVGLQ